jgi:hypothetical protein
MQKNIAGRGPGVPGDKLLRGVFVDRGLDEKL